MPRTPSLEARTRSDLRSSGSDVEAVGVPVYSTSSGPEIAPGSPGTLELGSRRVEIQLDAELCSTRKFKAKLGETLIVSSPGHVTVVFVGAGSRDEAMLQTLRRFSASFVRSCAGSSEGLLVVPDDLVLAATRAEDATEGILETGQAIAEGAILGSYSFTAYKTDEAEDGGLGRLIVDVPDEVGDEGHGRVEVWGEGLSRGAKVAEAVCLARDLVNEPPSSLTPASLAEVAQRRLTPEHGISLEIWDEDRIKGEHLGGLLGVARGSAEPPRLIRATFEPSDPISVDGRTPHVVLVGKGITFDSGGLSLKTPSGMTTMKTDMSGAAAVIAALSACADLGVRVRVTAIAPVTENMPGGRATKPGDVLTIRNGMTIEVLNTDAEGRLVLADGLSLAAELEPDAIIDLATLTGACVVALGNLMAGVFTNDEALEARVRAASDRAGEPTWPLPLPDEYRRHIDSEVADMKNIGKEGQAGAIAAAMLLAKFVGSTPWVHLDIAGPARSEEDSGIFAKGGTGFGVRTLLELLASYSSGD